MQDLIPQISTSEIPALVKETHDIDPKLNLHFQGPPGVGKTDGVFQGAKLIEVEYGRCPVSVLILSQMESSDFSIPWVYPVEHGEVTYRKIPLADFIMEAGTRMILFADEANNASFDVQKAWQNILSSRKIGSVSLPDKVQIVSAGNRKEDRAGSNGLLSSLSNRSCIVECSVDPDGWQKWAIKNNISGLVRYYLNENPSSLFDFDPKREINATPRQWAKVSNVIQHKGKFLYTHIAGLVGTQKATHLKSAIDLFDQLPRKVDIISDPHNAKLPKKPDWAVPLAFNMIEWMDESNRDALITYLLRLGLEHQSMVFKSLKEHKIDMLIGNKEFVKWAKLNQDLILGG